MTKDIDNTTVEFSLTADVTSLFDLTEEQSSEPQGVNPAMEAENLYALPSAA